MIYKNDKDITIDKIGGKAYNLRHLSKIPNINIPNWFCLPVDTFYELLGDKKEEYLNYLKNYKEDNREKIIALINNAKFSDETKNSIEEELNNYNHIAVRSSAVDEDSSEYSFAGMLESYLDIPKEEIFDYIKKCYISCFSERIMEYRANNNLINDKIAISVIVMEYIDADYAGVVFTTDPQTNNPDEIKISIVEGIGEGLVSGEKNSSDYTLNIFNEIVDKKINSCEIDEALLKKIADISRTIEDSYDFKSGKDIEFAIKNNNIYILQCRNITSYSNINKRLERTILDNSNIIESYSGVTTPLTYTFAKEVYSKVYHQTLRNFFVSEEAIASIEDDLNNMLYFYENKIYYKLNSWYKMTSLYPGYEKNKKYMENMMGVKTPLEETSGQAKTRLIKIYMRFIHKMLRMKKDSKAFLDKFNRVTGPYRNNKFENKKSKELIEIYNQIEKEILDDFTTPIANDMGAMVLYGMLSEQVKKQGVENGEGKISKIISKQGNVESVKQTTELISIVEEIKANEELLELFREKGSKELEKLIDSEKPIFKRIKEYLLEFGSRSMEELKLETITMIDNPEFLFDTIKEYLEIDLTTIKNDDIIDDSILLDEFHFLKKFLIKKLIKYTKYFIRNRECLRLRRTYIYDIVRNIMNRLGKNYKEENIIDNERDIYYLEKQEVFDIALGKEVEDIKNKINLRKKEYNENKEKEANERMYFYGEVNSKNMIPIYNRQEVELSSNALSGVPGGGKVVEGIVKYINDPREKFPKGYILMAKRTDPGWTILFPLAKAIIIERGSILSHSAVVAREMGITLVVGVRGLTSKIKDGDRIKVDGINGTIELIGDDNG